MPPNAPVPYCRAWVATLTFASASGTICPSKNAKGRRPTPPAEGIEGVVAWGACTVVMVVDSSGTYAAANGIAGDRALLEPILNWSGQSRLKLPC
jgi:hypothetical protein